MAQVPASGQATETRPLDENSLCLLSLDGGGVRGLSTLYIIKALMDRLNHERQQKGLAVMKPCEVFDLMGGTSTGGLIAIMLGRLEMNVEDCISAYNELMTSIFGKKSHTLPVSLAGRIRTRFDSARLKHAIMEVINRSGRSETELFNNGSPHGCRVFVCTAAKQTAGITHIRSYSLPDELDIPATICDAALATSAATSFFDPTSIGARQFVDGALGANNPVDEVEKEASNIWCSQSRDLKSLVKCFISIGTGHPGKNVVADSLLRFVSQTLVRIAAETDNTETNFTSRWAQQFDTKRYFRFNVEQGLQNVKLAEYKERGLIESVTDEYLRHTQQKFRIRDCVENLNEKRCKADDELTLDLREFNVRDTGLQTHPRLTGNVHFSIPRMLNPIFTGRERLVKKIAEAVCKPKSSRGQKRFVITGDGGQGKSELCIKIADVVRYEFWGLFWVDVSNSSTAEKDFIAVAMKLGLSANCLKDAQEVLANTKDSWLLILDNADNPDFDYQYFFPPGSHGAVIMTSRNPECARYNTIGSEVLEQLESKYSTQLLLKAANISANDWPYHEVEARKISNLLQAHTLALIQAGAYIARGHCAFDKYVAVYQRHRARLLKYQAVQARSRYGDVYATFEASAEILECSDTSAAKSALQLLDILSMLHFSSLPLEIFEEAWEGIGSVHYNEDFETKDVTDLSQWHIARLPDFIIAEDREWNSFHLMEAISLLKALSLLRNDESSEISMHPLAHAWAKDRQDSKHQECSLIMTGCTIAMSGNNFGVYRRQAKQMRPHILAFLDNVTVENATLLELKDSAELRLLVGCGQALASIREDERLERLLSEIFRTLKIDTVTPSPKYLLLYGLQAESLRWAGKYEEAIALYEQLVKILESTRREDHSTRLSAQKGLAIAFLWNAQIEQAISLLEKVFTIRKNKWPEAHPSRISSQHMLAIAYRENGQIEQATALLEEIVKIQGNKLAENHPDSLSSQHELARAYSEGGQNAKAVELLEKVVRIKDNTLTENHPNRLASQHELAKTYLNSGQGEKAIPLLEKVVRIQQESLTEDHPRQLISQHVLARAYGEIGQVDEAVERLRHVVKIRESILPETHPYRIESEFLLAKFQSVKSSRDQGSI